MKRLVTIVLLTAAILMVGVNAEAKKSKKRSKAQTCAVAPENDLFGKLCDEPYHNMEGDLLWIFHNDGRCVVSVYDGIVGTNKWVKKSNTRFNIYDEKGKKLFFRVKIVDDGKYLKVTNARTGEKSDFERGTILGYPTE